MKELLFSSSAMQAVGIAIIRVGVGALFIGHGYLKLSRGPGEWLWTGQQMANLGITFFPMFWGLCAVAAELLGGICLTLGLATRFAAAFMAFTMFVAVVHHIKKGDSYGYTSFPLSQMFVFLGFVVMGSGKYSLDYFLFFK